MNVRRVLDRIALYATALVIFVGLAFFAEWWNDSGEQEWRMLQALTFTAGALGAYLYLTRRSRTQ